MSPKIAILVNHLLGAGHLSRALTLGRAFAASDWEAHVISGGFPVPQFDSTGVHLHQMPPIRSDGSDFSRLLSLDGKPATDALFDARIAAAEKCEIAQAIIDWTPEVAGPMSVALPCR